MLKQVEPQHAAPDELLRSLDAEILLHRQKREKTQAQRTAFLAGGMLLILGGTTVALCALFSSLSGMSPDRQAHEPEAAVISLR